jgi:hypothetical protein
VVGHGVNCGGSRVTTGVLVCASREAC